ncbi:MAG: CHAP domain-containing protein [Alphaproteobacteria bacterium]|nr:CHAP domain-containing protein [Alphaproteobacteria bacterium]MDE2113128.1 CHAP domain-containing protein [Alphaproteobacteria bacterium]MDE2492277.1 CHAP domain-containing protein [Alphaproteobacteria bacterium]
MIHLDCARRVAATSLAAILILSAGAAAARRHHPIPVPMARPALASDANAGGIASSSDVTMPTPSVSVIGNDPSADNIADGTPTIIKSARRIFCVEFARLHSGIAIFGDARTWWRKAKGIYAEARTPQQGAVMVFTATRKMRLGHLAVVTKIVSDREIRVDHANWANDGKIWLNAPVKDVSADNNWSKVRVWNTRYGVWGGVYPVKGFVSFRNTAANAAHASAPID